jgi:hypothetical protein
VKILKKIPSWIDVPYILVWLLYLVPASYCILISKYSRNISDCFTAYILFFIIYFFYYLISRLQWRERTRDDHEEVP